MRPRAAVGHRNTFEFAEARGTIFEAQTHQAADLRRSSSKPPRPSSRAAQIISIMVSCRRMKIHARKRAIRHLTRAIAPFLAGASVLIAGCRPQASANASSPRITAPDPDAYGQGTTSQSLAPEQEPAADAGLDASDGYASDDDLDPGTDVPPGEPDPSCGWGVGWLPDGKRLIVNPAWYFDIDSGQFTPLPFSTWRRYRLGHHIHFTVSFSPSGATVVVADLSSFRVGPAAGPLGERVQVPRWLSPDPSRQSDQDEPNYRNLFFALSDTAVFVQQMAKDSLDETCRIYEGRVWRTPPGGCLSGDFHEIDSVDAGPGGWVVIYSSGELHPGLRIAKYDPDHGQQEAGPELDLHPEGPLSAYIRADGSGVDIMTLCTLERPRPCLHVTGSEKVRHYFWNGRQMKRLHADVPEHAVPSPDGVRFAWQSRERLCIRQPNRTIRCFAVPATKPPASKTPGRSSGSE
jgi:hypothetical protein